MAVIEIAKIQVRRGQEYQTGKPLTLDSGEFGWAVDTQKLYIGNGTLSEGAPAVGITEIYTEHSITNIFNLAGGYIYKGNTSSSPVITGPGLNGDNLNRSIQQKLDDIVNIADFGVTPHLTNTETTAGQPVYKQIQQAIDQIFLNSDSSNPESRRKLFFPAGTYVITGTVYVPPYANLIGEGVDKTILQVTSTHTSIMQFIDGTSVPPLYVADVAITSGGRPKNIYIEGLTFNYNPVVQRAHADPLLLIDAAEDTQIVKCKFSGAYNPLFIFTATYAGIDLRSEGSLVTNNVLIKDCVFDNLRSGIISNYNTEDVNILNSKFSNMYKGIAFSEQLAPANSIGPVRSNIEGNIFEDIKKEGVYIGSNTYGDATNHVVSFNSFKEVGNDLLGDGTGTNAIISFLSPGNVSIENKFNREVYLNKNGTDGSQYPASVHGKTFVQSSKSFSTDITYGSSGAPTLLTRLPYNNDTNKIIKMQYVVNKPTLGLVREGTVTVSIGISNIGTTATVTESYAYTDLSGGYGDGGIDFTATLDTSTNQVKIFYTSDNSLGTMDYQYSYLQQ